MTIRDYTRYSIGPVQIGASIQEGEINNPSLFSGHRPAFPISRFPPSLITLPIITGSSIIPATLTCSLGVFAASPQPTGYEFQWTRNGIIIPGANDRTYVTSIVDHNSIIKCVLRVISPLGDITVVTSNELFCQIFQSIDVTETELYILSGLPVSNAIDVMEYTPYIITGLSIVGYMSVVETDIYVITV
jgi:hypothetical protein